MSNSHQMNVIAFWSWVLDFQQFWIYTHFVSHIFVPSGSPIPSVFSRFPCFGTCLVTSDLFPHGLIVPVWNYLTKSLSSGAGITRSTVMATLPQIASRVFITWGVLFSFPEVSHFFFGNSCSLVLHVHHNLNSGSLTGLVFGHISRSPVRVLNRCKHWLH